MFVNSTKVACNVDKDRFDLESRISDGSSQFVNFDAEDDPIEVENESKCCSSVFLLNDTVHEHEKVAFEDKQIAYTAATESDMVSTEEYLGQFKPTVQSKVHARNVFLKDLIT